MILLSDWAFPLPAIVFLTSRSWEYSFTGPDPGLPDGHLVRDALYAVYVSYELAGQILFRRVFRFTGQRNHTLPGGDRGIESGSRTVIQQRHFHLSGDGSVVNF